MLPAWGKVEFPRLGDRFEEIRRLMSDDQIGTSAGGKTVPNLKS